MIEQAKQVAQRLRARAGKYDEYDYHSDGEHVAADTIDALIAEVERLTKAQADTKVDVEPCQRPCTSCGVYGKCKKVDVEPVAWMRPSTEGYDSAFRDNSTVKACTGNPWTGWEPLYPASALAAEQAKVRELATHLDRVLQNAIATSRNVIYTAERAGEVHAMFTGARAAIAKYGEQK